MTKEKHLHDLTLIIAVCNLAVILFYCLIRTVTTYRICGSFGAYDFLSTVRTMPQRPWVIPVQALGLYLLLCLLSYLKFRWKMCSLWGRLSVCVAELLLCIGVIASLDFYYSGVALLVLADLIYYIQHNRLRLFFMAVLIILFAFAQFEIVSLPDHSVAFTSYLSYYTPFVRSVFTGIESVLVSGNILLFVLYMILLFTGEQAENDRIRKLNQQLNDANTQLKDYAVELERMTEIRERNRLAREIHDTLGHTLTGIIMGADAALALFSMAPEEAKKRVQVIAQSAREGLTDVRRSIKALRPDALEQRPERICSRFRLYSLLLRLMISLDNQDNGKFVVNDQPGECVQRNRRIEKTFFMVCYKILKLPVGNCTTIPALTLKESHFCRFVPTVELRPITVQ